MAQRSPSPSTSGVEKKGRETSRGKGGSKPEKRVLTPTTLSVFDFASGTYGDTQVRNPNVSKRQVCKSPEVVKAAASPGRVSEARSPSIEPKPQRESHESRHEIWCKEKASSGLGGAQLKTPSQQLMVEGKMASIVSKSSPPIFKSSTTPPASKPPGSRSSSRSRSPASSKSSKSPEATASTSKSPTTTKHGKSASPKPRKSTSKRHQSTPASGETPPKLAVQSPQRTETVAEEAKHKESAAKGASKGDYLELPGEIEIMQWRQKHGL